MGNTGYDHATLTQNKLPSGGQETNNNMVAMAGGHHGYDRGYQATSTATTYPDLQTGECKICYPKLYFMVSYQIGSPLRLWFPTKQHSAPFSPFNLFFYQTHAATF